uniref:Bro-N domain-containing protein n=1 Tax=Candidatus Desulfatibia profunda TaxID=2841695 RepID=A0A8J6TJZ4_9BACT|nr:Bro-N domain-containing protein [Candidatus Desulfatibia profunda]
MANDKNNKNFVPETRIAVFKSRGIRKTLHNNEWWFLISDVVEILTDSTDPSGYIKDMRRRDNELSKGWGQIATPLLLETPGENQKINCANTEGIFRIIQSIPSPRAEPFKRWLARVGYERVQEIEDPEMATKRIRALYKAKGYSDAWIEKRMRGIAIHAELTEEWKNRDVKGEPEYAILAAEISKAAFGLTPSEYKELKGLERENLRDHMTDLELIFSMLGEAATTEITKTQDAQGVAENRTAARKGGRIAGEAREKLETETKRKVVTPENYLVEPESRKRLK